MHMTKHNQDGAVNVLLVPLILSCLLFIGAASFGFWAFGERQNYKDNVDQIVSKAVTAGKSAEATKKDAEFAEKEKNPLKTFTGVEAYGSVTTQYPKTWSAYDNTSVGAGMDTYFQPGAVPAKGLYALRIQVLNQTYDNVTKQFQSRKTVTAVPYSLPKVPGTVGIKIDGEFKEKVTGSVVLLPLRDKTLQISTETPEFVSDFNSIILPNLTFAP